MNLEHEFQSQKVKINRAARKPELRKAATRDSHRLKEAWFNFTDTSGNFSERQKSHEHCEGNKDCLIWGSLKSDPIPISKGEGQEV